MTFEDGNNDKCAIYDEGYYEELASEEEIYLEETEEELRAELLSLVSASICLSE
jgi:hypothetical protein